MNKTVLITGASRGIGSETARAFAAAGYHVAINYFSNEAMAQTLADSLNSAGCSAAVFKADVSVRSEVSRMVDKVQEQFGKIDVLVNNAGIAAQRLFTDISEEEWGRMLGVNLTGVFHCCQCVLPDMIHRKNGKIINISSIWGITGASCEVHYSTAKAGVIGLTKALAKEVGPSGICVNCVAPGVIDTDMNSGLDENTLSELKNETPLGRTGTPEDIANMIVFLASEKAGFITGQVISPNGGFLI